MNWDWTSEARTSCIEAVNCTVVHYMGLMSVVVKLAFLSVECMVVCLIPSVHSYGQLSADRHLIAFDLRAMSAMAPVMVSGNIHAD